MFDFELPGAFYLGRRVDEDNGATSTAALFYDSADLVTHGLCVGMTGSGKTGLGIGLIEEAALDGIPVIAIDPKGDLGNLLLNFPEMRGDDFLQWVNPDDAARAGLSVEAFAAAEARRWEEGLAAWGQDRSRIQRLRDSASFTLYTPGSSAGIPVSVLSSFAAPSTADPELRAERAQTAASSLLSLAGIDADPVKSREHILLSLLLLGAWEAGENPDLAMLISLVQQPPLQRVGVMELESFFPARERFTFALALNSLIAAPGFAVWTQGAALDISSFLRDPSGKPRVAVFSIAHLDDAQRMFFVALLLSAVTDWMRGQSGTTSLRALLYMDEIFGFFPPVANPPSKPPLLTLLKQARAFGLGVVLATQNPVDLDYKGLGNIGTWWLGRLQTERDKARLLDGLAGTSGASFDRAEMDRLLSGLRKRCFLMRNVHDKDLSLFETRWVMSYLRGPLSREDIRRLASVNGAAPLPAVPDTVQQPAPESAPPKAPPDSAGPSAASSAPLLAPEVLQYFAPAVDGAKLAPAVYAAVELRYSDSRLKLEHSQQGYFITLLKTGPLPVDWAEAERCNLAPEALLTKAPAGASFLPLPEMAARKSSYDKWSAELTRWLRGNEALELLHSPAGRLTSTPQEGEAAFRARLAQAMREQRDSAVAALRAKYAPMQATLQEKLRRAQLALAREQDQAQGQKLQTAISLGATLVDALLGRKALKRSTIGRATTTVRGARRAIKESGDIARAQLGVAEIEQQLRELDDSLAQEIASLPNPTTALSEPLERVQLLPKRGNVNVRLICLLWLPD